MLRSHLRPLPGETAAATVAGGGATSTNGVANPRCTDGVQMSSDPNDLSAHPGAAAERGGRDAGGNDKGSYVFCDTVIQSSTFKESANLFVDAYPPAFEPKVQVPFDHTRGRISRRIEVERRRRRYESVSVEELLRVAGLSLKDIAMRSNQILPVELFDDTTFDARNPSEWMAIARGNPNPHGRFLPAEGFFESPTDGSFTLRPCCVVDWDAGRNELSIVWGSKCVDAGHGSGKWRDLIRVARIYTRLLSEDPVVYVRRLLCAHMQRTKATAWIRYRLCCDAMPTEGVPRMDQEVSKRLLQLGTGIPQFSKERFPDVDERASVLLGELHLEWQRAHNRILLQSRMAGSQALQRTVKQSTGMDLEEIRTGPNVAVPLSEDSQADKTISTHDSGFDFAARERSFTFSTYFTQPEVVTALTGVRSECLKVLDDSLFALPLARQMTLDTFTSMQQKHLQDVAEYLKSRWIQNVCEVIRVSLASSGKGWLNVEESDQGIYEMSKLKRFFTTVRYMMEDTLFELVYTSLSNVVAFFDDVCAFTVTVEDMNNVTNTWPGSDADDAIEKQPLFTIDLAESNTGGFAYSVSFEAFENTIISLFDDAIRCTDEIPQVEKYVMNQYFWKREGDGPFLDSVKHQEERVCDLRERMRAALRSSLAPLQEYLETYHDLLPLVSLDKQKFVEQFALAQHTVESMKEEVKRHLKAKRVLAQRIPSFITVGNFVVNCQSFCYTMANKEQELAWLIMGFISRLGKEKSVYIREEFTKIVRHLEKHPQSAEKLYELKTYAANLGEKLAELGQDIDGMKEYYTILDTFQYDLSDDEFRSKWEAIGWPRQLAIRSDIASKELEKVEEELHARLVKETEDLGKRVDAMQRVVATFSKHTNSAEADVVAAEVKTHNIDIKKCIEEARAINNDQRLFGDKLYDYRSVFELEKEFKPYSDLWLTTYLWQDSYRRWHSDPFTSLDPNEIESVVNAAFKTMAQLSKTFKDKNAMLKIVCEVQSAVTAFKPIVPVVMALRHPGMKDRHWKGLSEKLGMPLVPGDTLASLTDCDQLLPFKTVVISHCEVAAKESQIESALKDMRTALESKPLVIEAYKETGTFVLKDASDVIELVDEQLNLTQQLQFSPFKAFFEEAITDWERSLNLISDIFEQWLECQRAWRYLEPIFNSEDIAVQLPRLMKLFERVDKTWRRVMTNAHNQLYVLEFCIGTNKLLDQLRECNRVLEEVQRGLSDYLSDKRQTFPRFYFLSDEELLAILSQAKEVRRIDENVSKLFEFIDHMKWSSDVGKGGDANADNMIGFFSAEGEYIPHVEPVVPEGNVEVWLGDVEAMMKNSMHTQLRLAAAAYSSTPRSKWVLEWPGQVVMAVSQIFWTNGCEDALAREGRVDSFYCVLERQLDELVDVVQSPLTPRERINMGALITIEVHAKDTVENLQAQRVSNPSSFEWMKQLRFYLEEDDERCHIRQVDAHFVYGGEYLGNTGRLVVTPLTDRIYLTLTGALALCLGGAPAGPAGTGKTETVKDLAKSLAKQCVVFNCQEGMTYLSMAKLFKGLAWAGAWACLDEFNRIDVEVLSVVAQQVTDLQQACLTKQLRIIFEGSDVTVDPTHAVFITMNPGYAGRTELPDNLKVLFRPVACMVPDYALIGEIRLFSYGYKKARNLAQKMVMTFKLSSEQLSSQDHYDFGMRAVNTVISAAGLNKRENPSGNEDELLLRALRDSNVPKFLRDDIVLFEGIVSDLFPGVDLPGTEYGNVVGAVRNVVSRCGQQAVGAFLDKCLQLYDITTLRHGLMLVGPTGSGKTSAYVALQAALTECAVRQTKGEDMGQRTFMRVYTHVCNPKAVTMDQLYGAYDENGEWKDGVLCVLFRRAAKYGDEGNLSGKHWVVFDGPVDALWIESMNTVLDENKKLCLVSGEIIQMSRDMTMVFEVEDLAVASPATVSRCGMIYMGTLSMRSTAALITSWVAAMPAYMGSQKEVISDLANAYLDDAVQFVRANAREYMPTSDIGLVQSFFRMFDGYIRTFEPAKVQAGGQAMSAERTAVLEACVPPLFFMSIVWSVGASCDENGRASLDLFLREEAEKRDHTAHLPPVSLGSLYDLCFTYSPTADEEAAPPAWVHWKDTVPPLELHQRKAYNDIIVPTIDNIRQNYVVHHLLTHKVNVAAVGPTGTGKSLSVAGMLLTGLGSTFLGVTFTFSAQTKAGVLLNSLISKLDKRRSHVYGAPTGKHFIVFIDDANLPQKERYGAQPPMELLRQLLGHGGCYSTTGGVKWNSIIDLSMAVAMGPPGGGRNQVSARLLRFFNFVSFPEMSDDSKRTILQTILHGGFRLTRMSDELIDCVSTLIDCTIRLFHSCCKAFLPTPAHVHYEFNMRDIIRVFGMIYNHGTPQTIPDKRTLVCMWIHENERVFADRLVSDSDRDGFNHLVETELKEHLGYAGRSEVIGCERLLFGDYVSRADPPRYEQITDMVGLRQRFNELLATYNSEHESKMSLVLFLDAIEHVSRIARVLGLQNGHCLLLGVGGSGRKSLTRLACSLLSDVEVFTVEATKSFGVKEWHETLAQLLLGCGLDEKKTAFLFSDTQLTHPTFMEEVAALLTSGDVPNLFEEPDIDRINNKYKGVCLSENLPTTKVSVYARFIKTVRSNLHVVLAFSPIGEAFRTRLRMFPALISCCTIDWFSPWPGEALVSVAKVQLDYSASALAAMKAASGSVPSLKRSSTQDQHQRRGSASGDDGVLCRIANCVKEIHVRATEEIECFFNETKRRSYVTPTSYLSLLQTFTEMLQSKRKHISEQKQRLEKGLDRLYSTEKRVAVLEEQLRAQQPVLKQKKAEIRSLMDRLSVDRKVAAEQELEARKEEAEATDKTEECAQMRRECANHLAEAEPALQEAVKVLSKIKATEITELNKYQNPPKGVQYVMEAVALLLTFGNCPKEFYTGQPGGKKAPDWWLCAKSYMKNANHLLETLVRPPEKGGFNRESMTMALIERVKVYYDNEEFQPEKVRSVSVPCMAMCLWVRAMYNWFFVNREIQPLREKLASAEAELERVTAALNHTRARLTAVIESVQALEKEYRDAVDAQSALEAEMERTAQKLSRAARLIDGLGGEKLRWVQLLENYSAQEHHLVGDMLIAAASVAYFGPLTTTYRRKLLGKWKAILDESSVVTGKAYDLISTSSDPVKIQQWQLCGLPTDSLSTENAIILSNAQYWPLLIDPQGQANAWIRRTHKDDNLQVCRPSEPKYMKTIEGAVRLGLPCLLENVGSTIEPALEPVLLRNVFTIGSTPHIRIGDSAIPYDHSFRLYITTKLPNPTYSPETTVMVSILNFFITPSGLEEQLLEKTVEKERHDLESAKQQLTRDMAEKNQELMALQDDILRMLEDVEGDILEEEALIITLERSKQKSIDISEDLAKARATEKTIDETRNKYRPHAVRGSLLFFCAADLAIVDPMYQFSLQWFISLFLSGIDNAEQPDPELIGVAARRRSVRSSVTAAGSAVAAVVAAARRRQSSLPGTAAANASRRLSQGSTVAVDGGAVLDGDVSVGSGRSTVGRGSVTMPSVVEEMTEEALAEELMKQRVRNLMDYFTYSFYSNVCRSLFEKHKLTFSLFLCASIIGPEGKLDANEFRYLLTGPTGSGGAAENPAPDWLTANSWDEIQYITHHLPAFSGFAEHVCSNIHHYQSLFDSASAHVFPLAAEWCGKETPLQRLVVMRCFRKDKVVVAVQDFVRHYLGEQYIVVPQFNLADVYKDSSCLTPIIFIISPGSDPMNDLIKFAEEMRMLKKLDKVSLGQGQGKKAEELLALGRERGQWVLLQNCHLATSWMPTLETIVESFTVDTVRKEFRLWLTSMPSSSFPVAVLQFAVKMTNEPPMGLRANVTRSYFSFKDDDLELAEKPVEFKKMIFATCLFHAVIQERRKFGSLGFNIAYEFNDSDRNVCLLQLRKFMSLYDRIPFDVLTFLSGEINYGGRVTDDWDRRCLMTLIQRFLCPEALNTGYAFSPSGFYQTVDTGPKGYYLLHLSTWPLNPEPEVFGLNDNADIASARNEAESILTAMLALTAGGVSGGSGSQSREQILHEVATGIFSKLPGSFNIAEMQTKYPTTYAESMNTVLVQEAVRYNRLLLYVRTSLAEFIKAVRGEVGMSAELEAVGASLYMNAVPASWAACAYPSLKPLSNWIDDLVQRIAFVSAWEKNGAPKAFWMGGFFFPQAFLTGTLQNYARLVREPIDTISFGFTVLSDADIDGSTVTKPTKGAVVYGLYMDGARWDAENGTIAESRPKELYVAMPPILFEPIVNRPKSDQVYLCPVYKTLTRSGTLSTTGHSTNFVLPIELPSVVSADHWISRGVACVVSLNY